MTLDGGHGEPRELAAPVLQRLDPDVRRELLVADRLRELLLAGRPIFR